MGARAWLITLAVAVVPRLAAAQDSPFRKAPYIGDVRATSAHILFELRAPAPATVTVTPPSGAALTLTSPAGKLHEVVVKGLTPGARHRYRVECAGAVIENDLTTAPTPGEDTPFTFILFGDSRDDNVAHRTI